MASKPALGRVDREGPVRRLIFLSLVGLASCQGDWRVQAVQQAETLIRDRVGDPSLQFTRVQFTGDNVSGQTCGYFVRRTADGGEVDTRFIVFVDGANGQNPFIDEASSPYPINKEDFALGWRTQCLDLGYKD
jgi:hypothetical protein